MNADSLLRKLLAMDAPQVRAVLTTASSVDARRWVGLLAFEGVAEAQTCFGRMLLEGTSVAKDERAALVWFRRAAAQGDADAQNMVGRCLENGWGCAIDPAQAAACYERAAAAGHAWAQYNLGHCYLDGIGVARDPDAAFRHYRAAADQGHARAMNLVGRCCEEGWGTPRNDVAASEWYQRSAEAGYFRGQYNWASVLLASQRVAEAIGWFERAAAAGTPDVRAMARRAMAGCDRAASPSVAPGNAAAALA